MHHRRLCMLQAWRGTNLASDDPKHTCCCRYYDVKIGGGQLAKVGDRVAGAKAVE